MIQQLYRVEPRLYWYCDIVILFGLLWFLSSASIWKPFYDRPSGNHEWCLKMMHLANHIFWWLSMCSVVQYLWTSFGLCLSGRLCLSPNSLTCSWSGDHTWLLSDLQPDGCKSSSLGCDLSVIWTTSCSCSQTNKNMTQDEHAATIKNRNISKNKVQWQLSDYSHPGCFVCNTLCWYDSKGMAIVFSHIVFVPPLQYLTDLIWMNRMMVTASTKEVTFTHVCVYMFVCTNRIS